MPQLIPFIARHNPVAASAFPLVSLHDNLLFHRFWRALGVPDAEFGAGVAIACRGIQSIANNDRIN